MIQTEQNQIRMVHLDTVPKYLQKGSLYINFDGDKEDRLISIKKHVLQRRYIYFIHYDIGWWTMRNITPLNNYTPFVRAILNLQGCK